MNFDFLFSYRQDYTLCNSYIDRQFNDVYFCRYPFVLENIQFNVNEVADLACVPLDQFKVMVGVRNSLLSNIYAKECSALEHLGLLKKYE
jgi:hypothetical protein